MYPHNNTIADHAIQGVIPVSVKTIRRALTIAFANRIITQEDKRNVEYFLDLIEHHFRNKQDGNDKFSSRQRPEFITVYEEENSNMIKIFEDCINQFGEIPLEYVKELLQSSTEVVYGALDRANLEHIGFTEQEEISIASIKENLDALKRYFLEEIDSSS